MAQHGAGPGIVTGVVMAVLLGVAASGSAAEDASPRADPWALPPAGSCAPTATLAGAPVAEDAAPPALKTGDVISLERLEAVRRLLPPAVWEQRDKFFFEGMQLEIGPCFRDYSAPAFFQEATQKFRGQAKLREDGGLEGFTAGLPFAPDTIDPKDPGAGAAWAWNVAERYQGGGLEAQFRVSDMVGLRGRAEPFEGEIYWYLMAHRADRAAEDYTAAKAGTKDWIAGGRMTEPFAAREYAWVQYRDLESLASAQRSDDLHAYLPEWRRVRRISASDVEGLFMPSFSVGVQQATQIGGLAGGADGGAVGGAIGASGAAGAITPKRTGFEGLVLRPQLYDWTLSGVQDLLAPLNAAMPSYPEAKERDFGPWGLSFGSDRWDLRRALVLEGRTRKQVGGDQVARLVLYVDLQTLQPLYSITYDEHGETKDVGLFVGRWSEDRPDYPKWPDDPARPVRVLDSAGASFANLSEGGGWRRESWTATAIPPDDAAIAKRTSVSTLSKGR